MRGQKSARGQKNPNYKRRIGGVPRKRWEKGEVTKREKDELRVKKLGGPNYTGWTLTWVPKGTITKKKKTKDKQKKGNQKK